MLWSSVAGGFVHFYATKINNGINIGALQLSFHDWLGRSFTSHNALYLLCDMPKDMRSICTSSSSSWSQTQKVTNDMKITGTNVPLRIGIGPHGDLHDLQVMGMVRMKKIHCTGIQWILWLRFFSIWIISDSLQHITGTVQCEFAVAFADKVSARGVSETPT